ncbi:hypothetical protein SOQ14_00380 [Erythrobacter sp. T5W1-R]|uniref:hypothetical protein n=1 Tax=Erythrobacter sp. T5W1-R TaxID=3101752 RepID=UPI002AFFF220|nr:hypothetical protein [Erythrobacter sp. T5W1-R]MEA1617368.1 hypothetical protein [Erythrobacter sp. T5W1-R]
MNLRWFFTTTATAIAIATASPAAMAQNPDASVITRYIELCEWLTDVRYTPAQRQQLRAQVEAYWQRGDQRRIDTVLSSLDMHKQLADASPTLRETTLAKIRPGVLVSLQKDAADGGTDSAWLYQQFLAANPPLAQGRAGSVPLTRDMVDAALDYEHFIQGTVLNRGAPAPTAAARRAAYAAAARDYPRLSVAQQLEIAAQPGRLIEERNLWQLAGRQGQAFLRAEMGGNLTVQDQALIAEARQAQSGAGWAGIQSEINAFNQNTQTIMGSGTTWNSAAGRWEQRGGIVTEYDSGVVRVP